MEQKKEIKLQDIADELGVSIVSVSNALKEKKGVSEDLRDKVFQKAEELGYKQKGSTDKNISTNYKLGIIIAERYVKEYPSLYMDIYRHVAENALKQGALTVLEIIDMEKENLIYPYRVFMNVNIDGIIIIGEINRTFIDSIVDTNAVPIVCVDFYTSKGGMDYIVTDSFHGMKQLTQKLIDLGHRNISFIGTPYATNSIMDRYMGYCKALLINGIEEKPDNLIYDRSEDGFSIDFELPEKMPTAFVCNCDKTAGILIEKLNAKGLRVPQDISVVGFDHFSARIYPVTRLVTYESDQKLLAYLGVNTIIKRIQNKADPEGIKIIPGTLIDGDSIDRIEVKL